MDLPYIYIEILSDEQVYIRNEGHTVFEAIHRQLTHKLIMLLVKLHL